MRLASCLCLLAIIPAYGYTQPALVLRKPAAEFDVAKSEKVEDAFSGADLSPDGKFVVCARQSRRLTVFAVADSKPLFTTEPIQLRQWHFRTGATFSADGGILAVPVGRMDDQGVAILSGRTGKVQASLKVRFGHIDNLALSPDGKKLAVACGGLYHKNLDIFDAATGKLLGQPLKDVDGRADQLVFSADGKRLIAKHLFRIYCLDMDAYRLTNEVRARASKVFFQGDKLLALLDTKPMAIHEVTEKGIETMPLARLADNVGFVGAIAGNPAVAAIVDKNEVSIQNLDGKELVRVVGEDSPVEGICLSADARVLLVMRLSRRVEVFRVE